MGFWAKLEKLIAARKERRARDIRLSVVSCGKGLWSGMGSFNWGVKPKRYGAGAVRARMGSLDFSGLIPTKEAPVREPGRYGFGFFGS